MIPIRDQVAIVGIGQTAFGKGLEDTELSLACQAISAALDDAGIAPSEVDGLASFTMEPNREVDVARNVGMGDITYFSQVGYGGGAGPGVIGNLALAVASGQCNVGVAWRSRKRASGAVRRPWANPASTLIEDIAANYTRPFGVLRPVDEIRSAYYLRVMALDRPGVLAQVAGILGQNDISLVSVLQKERARNEAVPVVMMTHEARERDMRAALSTIDKLPVVASRSTMIRVEA